MTTGKAHDGKSYAGNPHVRSDEGEIASAATPRRWSLPYRTTVCAILLAAVACADALPKAPPEGGSRAARFATPPASARILPLHHGRPNNRKANDAELRNLMLDGFGGMASNVSFGTNYLDSAADWDTLRHMVKEAKASGMALWLYDEDGYPSGTARDKTLKGHPEWQARGVLIAVTNVSAGARAELVLPPGTFRLAVACPMKNGRPDTDAAVNLDACAMGGKVTWTAPAQGAVRWRVFGVTEDYLHESTHAALSLALKQPYINLLMREPTARFIALTHDRYAKELGEDLKVFTSTFTDEPSLMSCWMRPMPYYVLPWCPDLPADYRARTGRDLLADVPAIVCESASGTTPKLRYGFWNMVGDRVSRNYMGQLTEWAAKHGILSGGHLLAEEGLSTHVPYYGDFFRCLRALSSPGIDCLTSIPSQVPWITAQFGGSAGALNGSRYVMCEASDHSQRWRRPGDTRPVYQVSEEEVVGSLNRLVWGGVNTFTSYYRWGAFTREQVNRINTVVGRAVTLMSEGQNGAEVALLYPAEALMSTYRPGLHGGGGPDNVRVASCFRNCGASLFEGHRAFMFVDAPSLAEAQVSGDALVRGDLRWRVVVLPHATTLSSAALRNVYAFWKAGGAVIAVGACPANSEAAFPDATAVRLCAEMFGAGARGRSFSVARNASGGVGVCLAGQQAATLCDVVDALLESPLAVTANAEKAALRVARRRTAEGDVVFALNDSPYAWRGTVRLAGNASAELWEPRTGTHVPAAETADLHAGGPRSCATADIALDMPPFGAVLLTTARPLAQVRRDFDEKKFTPTEMPFVAPVKKVGAPSRARDVKAEHRANPDGSAWGRAHILKGGVDTFMFLPFVYASSPCVDGMRGITFETDVKDDQPYAPELLVFASMEDGSMYLAHAGRSLADRGRARVYVPFSSFARHGASGKTAVFDLAKIRQFSIGFGGYFGEEGQKIALEVTPPVGYR